MDRLRLCALLTLLVGIGGCIDTKDPEEREDWNASRWKETVQENQQRLLIEDKRGGWSLTGPVAKVTDTIVDQIVLFYNYLTGNTPFNAAKAMLDPVYPDRRRNAIMYFSKKSWGRQDPYVTYFAEMVRSDPDYSVRAMALRALNRARSKENVPLYIRCLNDPNEKVRLEAAKALANIPDATAVPRLLEHLNNTDENIDVRIACADALREYRTKIVAQALIRALGDRDFAVAWQSRISLKLMTGRDYRYAQGPWREYVAAPDKPFD